MRVGAVCLEVRKINGVTDATACCVRDHGQSLKLHNACNLQTTTRVNLVNFRRFHELRERQRGAEQFAAAVEHLIVVDEMRMAIISPQANCERGRNDGIDGIEERFGGYVIL